MRKISTLLLFLFITANPGFSQTVSQAHTELQLLSEQNAVVPGQTFWLGLDFKMEPGWDVYWRNPGDSGLAPKVKWQLVPGIKTGKIQWPYPQRINVGPLTTYGYLDEVLLLIPVTVDANPRAPVNLHARVDWLACREECIPGHAQLSITLPVAAKAADITYNGNRGLFDRTRRLWPRIIPSLVSAVSLTGNAWHLDILTGTHRPSDIVFFPLRNDVIEHAALQQATTTAKGYQITLTKSHLYPGALTMLEGIAVNPKGWDEKGDVKAVVIAAPLKPVFAGVSFVVACFFAFIGGLILNLMPCVLPVLSIKVLGLIDRHPEKKSAVAHALTYALGVLASMWSLALLLFILKSAGKFAGWGFQFQSPVFVLVMALILFILALNLFGVFEIAAPNLRLWLPGKTGYQASFLSGILTTIVATPCTAPFMGTALTVALGKPGMVGFGIFTFLGLGLSCPFVLLSVFPRLLSFIPKPGRWMVYLKNVLGILLVACVVWLLWVFSLETPAASKWTQTDNPSEGIYWQSYSPTAVARALDAGKGVFIDFTAGWCINCQVNDRLVLQNQNVVAAFKEKDIQAFKADWTKYDPVITRALASFGRDSIPVYVYYPPQSGNPVILPQIITPQMIVDHVRNRDKR